MGPIESIFLAVRSLMERGGDVLAVIALTVLVMWTLILDRFVYLLTEHRQRARRLVDAWHARPDRDSWHAERIYAARCADLAQRLNRGIPTIKALAAVCPLLGLLGTVLGMISIFETASFLGNSSPRTTASGVSTAIVTTMAGMVGALSGLFPAAYLARQERASTETLRIAQHEPAVVAHGARFGLPTVARRALAPLGALVITVGLMFAIEQMIVTGRAAMTDSIREFRVDFVRIPAPTTVERRIRRPDRLPDPGAPPEWQLDTGPSLDGAAVERLAVAAPRIESSTAASRGTLRPSGFGNNYDGDYMPLVKVAPVYPRRAEARGQEGWVLLRFTVLSSGGVTNIEVVESSDAVFEDAAVDAVANFRYRPRILNGEPIEVRGVLHRVTFVLNR